MAKLPMVMKNGKRVPAYAADGVGKMNKGGSVEDKAEAKMFLGGIVSRVGKLIGRKIKDEDKITAENEAPKSKPKTMPKRKPRLTEPKTMPKRKPGLTKPKPMLPKSTTTPKRKPMPYKIPKSKPEGMPKPKPYRVPKSKPGGMPKPKPYKIPKSPARPMPKPRGFPTLRGKPLDAETLKRIKQLLGKKSKRVKK